MRLADNDIAVVGISLEEAVSRAYNGDDLSDYLYWGEDVTESHRNLWYLSMELVTVVPEDHDAWEALAVELDK